MTGIEPALAVESAPVYQTGRQATLGLCGIDFIASFDLAVQKRTIPKGNAMTFASVVIVALWCSPAAPIDTFNPHQLGAALAFVQANPADCGEDAPLELDRDVTLEACQAQAMLHYMPQWQKDNPGRIWLGARCEPHELDVIMGPADQKAEDRP